MKIAVTYENGEVFQHFGHTKQFKLYEIADGKVGASEVVDTLGSGHGALAGFLGALGVEGLICGGIGAGARTALAGAGIALYPGVTGAADAAAAALAAGTLQYNPAAQCAHHEGDGHDGGCHGHDGCTGGHGQGRLRRGAPPHSKKGARMKRIKLFGTPGENSGDAYINTVYFRVICLAFLAHLFYILLFAMLSFTWLAVYNIGSVLFYLLAGYMVHKKHYRLAVTAVHVEVCLFVSVTVLLGGWQLGIHLYLLAIASLVYFCPFDHKYVPYLFSAAEIALFLGLRVAVNLVSPYYPALAVWPGTLLYLYNACACFAVILYAAFSSDVSAAVSKKALQDENKLLADLANYDQLTGLLSRREFFRRVAAFSGETAALAMGDIDDFKKVNDTYGHLCGDYILCTAAKLMRKHCDVQTDVCRWGGEEFLLFFHNAGVKRAKQQVQALCDAVGAYPFQYEKTTLHITMTFGICTYSAKADLKQQIACADKCMYAGKRQGKNRVVDETAFL